MFTMTTDSESGSAQFSLGSGVCDGRRCRERDTERQRKAGHHEAREAGKDMVGRCGDHSIAAVTHSLEDSRAFAWVTTSVVATIRF